MRVQKMYDKRNRGSSGMNRRKKYAFLTACFLGCFLLGGCAPKVLAESIVYVEGGEEFENRSPGAETADGMKTGKADIVADQAVEKQQCEWKWTVDFRDYDAEYCRKAAPDCFVVYNKAKKFGVMDYEGHFIIPCEMQWVGRFSEGLLLVEKDSQYFYMDRDGNRLGSEAYEGALSFSEGLAAVRQEGKWGYINQKGEMVIAPQYRFASSFSEGLAAVQYGDKWGFIDAFGKNVTAFEYDQVRPFREGYAVIEKKGRYGLIDKNGNMHLECEYDMVDDCHEGYTAVCKEQWGMINCEGEVVIPFEYDWIDICSEGLVAAEKEAGDGTREWLYLNKKGEIVIENTAYQYHPGEIDTAYPFQGGHAFVPVGDDGEGCLIDRSGMYLFDGRNSEYKIESSVYHQGLDLILISTGSDKKRDKRYGLMGANGEIMLKPEFEWISMDSEGSYFYARRYENGILRRGIIEITEY